jgi:hypothetical protein
MSGKWLTPALAMTVLPLAPCSWAQSPPVEATTPEATKEEKPYTLTFKPVLLDSGSSAGTSLGLDYDFKAKYEFAGSQTGAGSPTIDPNDLNKTFKKGQLDLRARGTLASSKEKNPNKLLDFSTAGVLKLDAPEAYYKIGGILAYETDQGFDNKQYMYGVTASASKVRIFMPGDAGSVLLNYGTVKPTDDAARKEAIGNLDSFKRWDVEVSYSIPINKQKVRSIDFDYRLYQETSPPDAIKAAGMDRNRLGLVRVNLDQDFFLQYSRGSLPFDQKSERVIKIGWSAKFE